MDYLRTRAKHHITPFNAKTVGDLFVLTGETGDSAVSRVRQLFSIEEFGDRIKLYGGEKSMIPRIKETIRATWPMTSFVESVNALIVACDLSYNPNLDDKSMQFSGCRKVAIVGVEGSGKTVMLSGLGALYSQPDECGYFLSPKNFETVSYVNRQMSALMSGKWPAATTDDTMRGLNWDLRQRVGSGRPRRVGELSFLDFAGEVYRAAFVRNTMPDDALANEVGQLKEYLSEADRVLVLVNLSDIIKHGPYNQRVEEAIWVTNAILDSIFPEDGAANVKTPVAAIVLSQSDNYKSTIEECGGPTGTLQKYLPHVANNYGWLDTFAVCTVDKTVLDKDGNHVPAPDFTTKGLMPIMDWILGK